MDMKRFLMLAKMKW